jgi:hypothetical protein
MVTKSVPEPCRKSFTTPLSETTLLGYAGRRYTLVVDPNIEREEFA